MVRDESWKTYLNALNTAMVAGDATEHTHRPGLKVLLEALEPGLIATNEPRQLTACGKPDMAVRRGPAPLGYVETKDVGHNLDEAERSPQLKRYRAGLPNLILTDYLEFRWYVEGERRGKAVLGRPTPDGKIKAAADDVAAVEELLRQFLAHQAPAIGRADDLAARLAGLAHLLRGASLTTLEAEPDTGALRGWLTAFEKTLLPDLPTAEFADMYAQTLTYGLFAARVTLGGGQDMRRDAAATLLPETNPFLKRLFFHLTGPDAPPTVAWVIDDMVSVLNAADMEAVLADFGKGSLEKDPVVHFYETFLAAYDPERRKVRGVYYTPEPVVSYIVRAIDHLLKERFGRAWGLADHNTFILDPACGTGTFLHAVIALMHDTLWAQGQTGGWGAYVAQHLLPRVFGFELLMAPYAIAHLKLGLLLKDRGYDFKPGQRLGVYLTNTLDEAVKQTEVLYGPIGYITEEGNTAARIKKDDPIEVILGNPPYAGHSANASVRRRLDPATGKMKARRTWIGRLIEDYKQVDGQPLGEKNPKMLQDDYVKFLRWGQWRLDRTGRGVLAMITNHGYLDNPTFRGMRQSLMRTFNEIYLLNLHGNARKKEVCPDGSKDANVFDIQQGVAIGIFVRNPEHTGEPRVYHADLWGLRKSKYAILAEMALTSTAWQEVRPTPPFYLFVPQDVDMLAEYERGWPLNELFPVYTDGLFTSRDQLTIKWSADEVWDTVRDFAGLTEEEAREKYRLGPDVRDWKVKLAQADIAKSGPDLNNVARILYRPFDVRFTYYTGKSRGYICKPRPAVMRHLLTGENLALISARSNKSPAPDHFFCSRLIIEKKCGESTTQSSLFPLYLYPEAKKKDNPGHQNSMLSLCEPAVPFGRRANIDIRFLQEMADRLDLIFIPVGRGDLVATFGPEDVFYYAYAVFYSPTYRRRYAEFLKVDFPRLPLTRNQALFAALVGKGAELSGLHLMESPALGRLITAFPVSGSSVVDQVRYDGTQQRVYINEQQFFAGVAPQVWAFKIGGYQVLLKWLKDRRGRSLSFQDLQHYQRIVVAITETIRLMADIDAAIEAHGGWPLARAD